MKGKPFKMTGSNLDDIKLLELLQIKNEVAFAEIYTRYNKMLYRSAFNILRDKETAKDAVQEVFISLWQRGGNVVIQNLEAYLRQAIRFQVLKVLRMQKNDERFYERLATVTVDIINENPLLLKEQEALLIDILESLPADCRAIFTMSREDRLPYRQIAGNLKISEKTVEKKMSICLKRIRHAIENSSVYIVRAAKHM